jgi:hypothetical protein
MASIEPGYQSVEYGTVATIAQPSGDDLRAQRDFLVELHKRWHLRVEEVTRIANGEWDMVWPDLTKTQEAPTVANIVEMGIAHWSSIFGSQLPTLRCPVPVIQDRAVGKKKARKRERRLMELWEQSNILELLALGGGDYAGTGAVIFGVWADFTVPAADRNPYILRFDPRHTYLLKDQKGDVQTALVARRISRAEFRAKYPEYESRFTRKDGEMLEEWFWFKKDEFILAVADASTAGQKDGVMVLAREENKLGFVPVVEEVRPSFDGQRRGLFDQALHVMRTIHRLMSLTIMATEEDVFPPILEFNVLNPEDFGPAGMLHARSQDAKMERIQGGGKFDVKDLIARLGDELRQQSAFPQQLTGEPGASIISARGISASMGQIDARLALAHKQFERLLTKISSMMLRFDEIYCPGEKTIHGDDRMYRTAETYDPKGDVNGHYVVTVTYGIGAGSDPQSREMRMAMWLSNEVLSAETVRENLPFLPDPTVEELRRARSDTRKAIMLGVLQQASQGNLQIAGQFLAELDKEDVSIDDAIEGLMSVLQAPAPSPGTGLLPPGAEGGGGVEALQQVESLARGGIPGNARQAPPSVALPPMQQLLSGPRQAV